MFYISNGDVLHTGVPDSDGAFRAERGELPCLKENPLFDDVQLAICAVSHFVHKQLGRWGDLSSSYILFDGKIPFVAHHIFDKMMVYYTGKDLTSAHFQDLNLLGETFVAEYLDSPAGSFARSVIAAQEKEMNDVGERVTLEWRPDGTVEYIDDSAEQVYRFFAQSVQAGCYPALGLDGMTLQQIENNPYLQLLAGRFPRAFLWVGPPELGFPGSKMLQFADAAADGLPPSQIRYVPKSRLHRTKQK